MEQLYALLLQALLVFRKDKTTRHFTQNVTQRIGHTFLKLQLEIRKFCNGLLGQHPLTDKPFSAIVFLVPFSLMASTDDNDGCAPARTDRHWNSRDVDVHGNMAPIDWEELFSQAKMRKYPESAAIIAQGATTNYVYRLVEGHVHIRKTICERDRPIHIATLRPPAVFGEICVVHPFHKASAEVVAAPGGAVVHAIKLSHIQRRLEENTLLAQRFYKYIALQLAQRLRSLTLRPDTGTASDEPSKSFSKLSTSNGEPTSEAEENGASTSTTQTNSFEDEQVITQFQERFGLANEDLVSTCECSLKKLISTRGDLYISTNFLFFYAKLFALQTKITIALADILDITYKKQKKVLTVSTVGTRKIKFTEISNMTIFQTLLELWQEKRRQLLGNSTPPTSTTTTTTSAETPSHSVDSMSTSTPIMPASLPRTSSMVGLETAQHIAEMVPRKDSANSNAPPSTPTNGRRGSASNAAALSAAMSTLRRSLSAIPTANISTVPSIASSRSLPANVPQTDVEGILTESDWAAVLTHATRVTMTKGTPIVREGTRNLNLYHITCGVCKITLSRRSCVNASEHRNGHSSGTEGSSDVASQSVHSEMTANSSDETVLGRIRVGESFGEVSFLESGNATATVSVESPTAELYVVDGEKLWQLLHSDPPLATRFFHYIACMLSQRVERREVLVNCVVEPIRPAASTTDSVACEGEQGDADADAGADVAAEIANVDDDDVTGMH